MVQLTFFETFAVLQAFTLIGWGLCFTLFSKEIEIGHSILKKQKGRKAA